MKEKERFELFGEHCIKDNNPDARCQLLNAYAACVILNEQDKRIKELEQKNQQLKQQLHDLPKKIVEEIKGKLHDRLSKIASYGRMTTDEFSFFVENEFTKDIDTILKKYGGKNDL